MSSRRSAVALIAASAIILFATFQILAPQAVDVRLRNEEDFPAAADVAQQQIIMPKMSNETAKAELGRAGWRLLHTMGQRYPDKPTPDEQQAFTDFLHLFGRMYPCGECAQHFTEMLQEFPVQSSSKTTASLYLCMLHNKVNERLHKPEFDCSKLEGLYDCGCKDDTEHAAHISGKVAVGTIDEGEDSVLYDPVTGEELIPG